MSVRRALLLGWLLAGLSLPALVTAANKIFVPPGTGLTFQDSGATGGTLTLASLASGAGQYSARYDKNALVTASGAMPAEWIWHCHFVLSGTPTAGHVLEIYVSWSDGTNAAGGLGTTTAALGTDRRRNLRLEGYVVVDQTTASPTITGWGRAYIPTRYFSVGVWNATSVGLSGTANVSGCTFYPAPQEIQ